MALVNSCYKHAQPLPQSASHWSRRGGGTLASTGWAAVGPTPLGLNLFIILPHGLPLHPSQHTRAEQHTLLSSSSSSHPTSPRGLSLAAPPLPARGSGGEGLVCRERERPRDGRPCSSRSATCTCGRAGDAGRPRSCAPQCGDCSPHAVPSRSAARPRSPGMPACA